MSFIQQLQRGGLAGMLLAGFALSASSAHGGPTHPVYHRTVAIDGLNIFYREAGDRSSPTVLLLHGFPTSSHMFRELIPRLADRYHVVAPDYPGYGNSDAPPVTSFDYSFDNMAQVIEKFTNALSLERYSLYMMDYGAPVGFRLATAHPKRVQALIIQNGNAYDEGLEAFWEPLKAFWANPDEDTAAPVKAILKREATIWQYTNGTRNPEAISPDNWNVDQPLLDREGNEAIQMAMFLSYGSNPPLYPAWQNYLRTYQPPTLIVWGKNDEIFPESGAHPYKRDLKTIEFHLLDTGHFALEEDGEVIAELMRNFLKEHVN